MSLAVVRGLRRFVDALQRSLFDGDDDDAATGSPAPSDLSRHPRATRELVLDAGRIAFLLKRSRRRSIGFVVGAEGLSVSAPKWVGLREIDAAVREKSRWIVARLVEQRERAARLDAARIVWQDGAELMFLGRPIRIVVDARCGRASGEVALDDALDDAAAEHPTVRCLRVGLPADAGPERLRDTVQSWLQREALAVFEARCRHYAALLGVRVTKLSLSSAATRWGSANANGAVRLHWRLVHYPLATIDYVVAHELAHLREMNHSARFWSLVRSVIPEFEAARIQLRGEGINAID